MARYILAVAAEEDIAEIARYIRERASRDTAKRVITRLRQALRKLSGMPGLGHSRVTLVDESLRVWRVYFYLIIYRIGTKPLQIIRVLRGARDIESIFETDSND